MAVHSSSFQDSNLTLAASIAAFASTRRSAGFSPLRMQPVYAHLAKALTEINAHSSKAPLPAPQGCSKTSWVAQSEPRPNYRRLSRYDVIGLIWLLHGLAGRSSPSPPTVR